MNNQVLKISKVMALLTLGSTMASTYFAGKAMKWEDLPAAVRATILANRGTAEQSVDLEKGKKNGLAIYEASVKDKDGNIADLDITADGELIETKHDDASDAAEEEVHGKTKIAAMKFSHPRDIKNPYLPLATLKQDILENGNEHVERTAKPDVKKIFTINGQPVAALAVEDKETADGNLAEITLDYFAQDDAGNVYYLGEDVDQYQDGKVSGHSGGWLLGNETQKPGLLLPAHPKVGDKFRSEDVPKITSEVDEVVSVSETVAMPTGTFQNCLKIEEHDSDGATEYKYYAPGIGCIKEVDSDGEVSLKSHQTW
jgi:hypothetical protein